MPAKRKDPSMPENFAGVALSLAWPEPGIALVTMTREREMNTLTLALVSEMARALDIAERARARAFIITGTGRAFCCGAHLDYFVEPGSPIGRSPLEIRDNYLKPIALLFDRFETMAFPVIAAINGFALGGGCEMAISADFRLMSNPARIGTPEVRLGATPGAGGVQKLARLVGRGKALEWILLGTHVSAQDAERFGLLFAVTAPEALLPAALDLARRLKALSPLALAQAKASVYVSEGVDLASARRFGIEALTLLIDQPDWREGMRAFKEKRAPEF
jgi:enoyl-CoA hydratase/carnithine racemase